MRDFFLAGSAAGIKRWQFYLGAAQDNADQVFECVWELISILEFCTPREARDWEILELGGHLRNQQRLKGKNVDWRQLNR